jgi:hypothetical protein
MSSGQNHFDLAEALADAFTVYMPDRRGRGLSGSFGKEFGIHKEVRRSGCSPSETGAVSHSALRLSLVVPSSGRLERCRAIDAESLLLGGSKSPAYLKDALDAQEGLLPRVERVEFSGLDHAASWNRDRGGKPEPLSRELREFLLSGTGPLVWEHHHPCPVDAASGRRRRIPTPRPTTTAAPKMAREPGASGFTVIRPRMPTAMATRSQSETTRDRPMIV